MTKRYAAAATPYQRVLADPTVTKKTRTAFTCQYRQLNPTQVRRDLPDELLMLVTATAPSPPGYGLARPPRSGYLDMRQRAVIPLRFARGPTVPSGRITT